MVPAQDAVPFTFPHEGLLIGCLTPGQSIYRLARDVSCNPARGSGTENAKSSSLSKNQGHAGRKRVWARIREQSMWPVPGAALAPQVLQISVSVHA